MAKFYQAVLKEVKGNVLDHAYPYLKGPGQLTMKERLGSDEGLCPECGQGEWMLYPKECCEVKIINSKGCSFCPKGSFNF